MRKTLLKITKNGSYAVISIFAFMCLWATGVHYSAIKVVMPGPWEVVVNFLDSFIHPIGRHTMPVHILYSLMRVVPAYIVGSIVGIVLGILMGWYRPVNSVLRSVYELIRPIPPIAWIPISIVWFGIGEGSKWFLIYLAAFVPVTLNSISGARSVDPMLIKCGEMLGASKQYIFKSIVLPFSVPYIFSGLQVGLAGAWATVVAAEMIRSTEGVGWIIISSMETNDVTQGLVGIIGIGIVGFLLATIMREVEDHLCAWTKREV
jgi:NitT/TauT family transport system permease protein/sulfonate transport system permease protein